MTAQVYIPSRGRWGMLAAKVIPKWLEQDALVTVIVEPSEFKQYDEALKPYRKEVKILFLPKNNGGINYSRNVIVKLAAKLGHDRIIQADDDIYPKPDCDVNRLFEWDGLNCLGIGIMMPFYGLMFGNQTMKDEDRPLMSKGALGKRLFSLNVPRVMACGNFMPELHSGWGDDELVRDGMAKLGATWYVHAGVWGCSVANRYTEGGINAFHGEDEDSRQKGQDHSHRIIYAKWGPRYVSDPYKAMRFSWQKFMDDYVPDWRGRIDWERR